MRIIVAACASVLADRRALTYSYEGQFTSDSTAIEPSLMGPCPAPPFKRPANAAFFMCANNGVAELTASAFTHHEVEIR